ncbi:MAG: acyl-CoA dehydrogenase [Alphaproteobacteria bacterium]|nr:acyl-CoA dehydrogenase [Alphaproteobacteria bacterium]
MNFFRFDPCELPAETEALRADVRAFLDAEIGRYPPEVRAQTWSASDPAFSRKMGAKGWIGMTWPKAVGGHERSFLERYVVLEEMLAAGAPVGAHWVADRQSGPLLLRYGTEAQRADILPRICRGEAYFCIGMSEPDSGSDLASVRTKAERVSDGWRINGTKLWTSGAQHAHYMIGLFRTSSESKHGGLTQFLVDMKTPGITVRPIRDQSGSEHFNEVTFFDCVVPPDAVIGAEGQGWAQVTAELAFERSGPERYLSSFRLLVEILREAGKDADALQKDAIGRMIAQALTLRRMSLSMAGMLARGEDPSLEAAVVKDQGALFEQGLPEIAHGLLARDGNRGEAYLKTLHQLTMIAPSFSLRGGTREILRGLIARGLGLR